MNKTLAIVIAIIFQTILTEKEALGIPLRIKSEPVQRFAAFSGYSQTNGVASFQGRFFRKQRGKYQSSPTSESTVISEWISGKLTSGKKPAGDAMYYSVAKYLNYVITQKVATTRASNLNIGFSNCYGSLYRLSPF